MNVVYNALVYVVWFIATFYVVTLLLVMLTEMGKLHEKKKWKFESPPRVSVLVPAYNEEHKIKYTIDSLKKIKYDNIEIIIINDGSKDKTSAVVNECIKGDNRFKFIDRQYNKGKAASLNDGIAKSTGEFIATMDADSIVEQKMFQKVLPYFEDKKVGAVTVSVLVKKPKTFLHKIFEFEYVIGLSLFLKTFSFIDAIFVTPGPFSVYRKSVLEEIKGFDPGNITEDLEIAYRLQKKHYRIENCMDAKVYTILPPTFKQICIQRKRWYSGAMLTVKKHRGMLLNSKYGAFGFVIFINYMLIFLGLGLFGVSVYLLGSHIISNIGYYTYTGIPIMEWLRHFQFDVLNYGSTTILGIISILFTICTLLVGLALSHTSTRGKKTGVLGFLLMFFLYQLFWIIAIVAVVRGRKIKWR
jgi:cellulose synthase/poly-beta-1,6-N-acetylglucosamine synthase-like glycosyltransferase